MAQAKKTTTKNMKTRKGGTSKKAKKVTADKAAPKSGRAKKDSGTSSRARKYSPRSRYQTFSIGDKVHFDQIQNWESDSVMESVTGTVVDKIDDEELGLKFIEVQFELAAENQGSAGAVIMRRFIVK